MLKGGYQIINLDHTEFELDTGIVFDGIYNKVESTTKPILISGVNVDGYDYHDAYCEPIIFGNYIFFKFNKFYIIIDDDDVVKICSNVIDLTQYNVDVYSGGEADISNIDAFKFEAFFSGIEFEIKTLYQELPYFVKCIGYSDSDNYLYTYVFNKHVRIAVSGNYLECN